MKTAISIPDDVFSDAEVLARRQKRSRSELYSRAVREYVAKYSPDAVTEQLDVLCAETEPDPFATQAAHEALRRSEW
ncbi:MAG: ribbon-helix-helix domain-containing protein [Coriobacteriia bacterium]